MGKVLNRQFTKEDIQMANMSMKRCSLSFVIGEIQINHKEITLHTHDNGIRMVCEDVEKLKFYTLLVGTQNDTAISQNSLAVSTYTYHMTQQSHS